VSAVLNDYRTAPIDEKVRATLALLEKITLEADQVGAQDLERLRDLHIAEEAVENALHVCVLFNIIDRVADALGFEVPAPEVLAFGAKLSLRRGYA
jgi:alkylhydroperoxidase family enzyme